MLCAVPLLRALRMKFPGAHIVLVTSPVNHAIMLNHPFVDAVLQYRKSPFSLLQFYRAFRGRRYDLAVVPTTVSISATSNFIALLSGARMRIGPRSLAGQGNAGSYCFTTGVDLDWQNEPRRHQTLRNLDILAPLNVPPGSLSMTIGITPSEKSAAQRFISSPRSRRKVLVGMHPGAGKVMNQWPPDRFASLADRLHEEHGAGIVVTAGPMDDDPLQALRGHIRSEFLIVERQPIRTVAAIIDQIDLFITNDTGIMHVAAATSASVLALFGPTDPLQWAPVGSKNKYIAAPDGLIGSLSVEQVYQMAVVALEDLARPPA